MKDDNKASARRMVLRAGVAALAAGLAGGALAEEASRRPLGVNSFAQEKLAKEAVQYQETPKDGAKCSACVNFVAPKSCQIVAGDINPEGWCVAFGPKSG